jgi:hypothetical protein
VPHEYCEEAGCLGQQNVELSPSAHIGRSHGLLNFVGNTSRDLDNHKIYDSKKIIRKETETLEFSLKKQSFFDK